MPNKTTPRKCIQLKRIVDYDDNPPRCETCVFRLKEKFEITGKRPYLPSRCKLNGFIIRSVGICNKWKGFNGSTLE